MRPAIVTYTHLPLVLLFAFFISFFVVSASWGLGRTDGGAGENGSILLFLCTCFEGPGGSMCFYGGKKRRQSYGLSVERIVTMKDMAFPRSREGRSLACLFVCCFASRLRVWSKYVSGRRRRTVLGQVYVVLVTYTAATDLVWDGRTRPSACRLAGIDMVQNRTQSVCVIYQPLFL